MNEPERFLASGGLRARLLESAKRDVPPASSRKRGMVVLASALAASTKVASATATVGTLVAWKWVAIGAVGLGTVVAAGTTLVTPRSVTMARAGATPARAISVPVPSGRGSPAPSVSAAPPVEAPPELPSLAAEPMALSSLPAAAPRAPVPTPTSSSSTASRSAEEPTRSDSLEPSRLVQPSSTLPAEISAMDEARQALKRSDPKEALRQLDEYRTIFPRATFATEASALHIEALARAGRREEAREELREFRGMHPESPLLESLARVVTE